VLGYWTVDEYDSLVTVVRNLDDEQKCRLEIKVQELVGSCLLEDLVKFVQLEVNRQLLLNVVAGQFGERDDSTAASTGERAAATTSQKIKY